MSTQYYLANMEAVMSDPGYDARLTYFFLGAILEAAHQDCNLSMMEYLEIENECVFNQRALLRLHPGLTPIIVRRCEV